MALVVGAAAAAGTYALIDNGDEAIQAATRVIVVETPAQHSAEIAGKNEATTAAAVGSPSTVSTTDEAATAAAISKSPGSETSGSKANASGTSDAPTAAEALRTDPHGTAASLRNP